MISCLLDECVVIVSVWFGYSRKRSGLLFAVLLSAWKNVTVARRQLSI